MKSILRIAWIAPAFLVAGLPAAGQQFPTKPVRIISPFAPGGGTDFVARLIAPRLTLALGQQVIVDNRPGAGGTLGTEIGVRSAPDGYTFVLISAGYCVNPSFYKIKFDPIADISPIIQIATGPLLIAARPALPATTVKELIALAKSKPGQINYATSGQGSMGHMAGELLAYLAGISMTHVPYKGTGPALFDTIAGHTDLNISGISTTLPHVKAGRLRAIAVTTAQRIAEDPEIPTIAESGLAGYDVSTWQGLIGPRGLPRTIVARINHEIATAITQKDIGERFQANGVLPVGGTPEQFSAQIRKEIDLWRKVVARAGIGAS
jgi:tripartite-type tricarboxylate transporter receptor subunit TctC